MSRQTYRLENLTHSGLLVKNTFLSVLGLFVPLRGTAFESFNGTYFL